MKTQSPTAKRSSNYWVIVADGGRARWFTLATDRTLTEFDVMVSPANRLHESDLTSDRVGVSFDTVGPGRHRMRPPHTTRQQGARGFAKRIAERVDHARTDAELDHLVLIAPAKFLGQLRGALSAASKQLVVLSIAKELTKASPAELARHLPRFVIRNNR